MFKLPKRANYRVPSIQHLHMCGGAATGAERNFF